MYEEQVRMNKVKDLQSQGWTDLGMNSIRWQTVGVSLCN